MLNVDEMGLRASRDEIDRIDVEIVELLKKRFKKAEQIGEKKRVSAMDIEDRERDMEVLKNYKRASQNRLDEEFIEKLVDLILMYSKEVQQS